MKHAPCADRVLVARKLTDLYTCERCKTSSKGLNLHLLHLAARDSLCSQTMIAVLKYLVRTPGWGNVYEMFTYLIIFFAVGRLETVYHTVYKIYMIYLTCITMSCRFMLTVAGSKRFCILCLLLYLRQTRRNLTVLK